MVLAFCLAPFALPQNAVAAQDAWHHEASAFYASGDYSDAYKKYLKLAKKGDFFAAYRVSYMNLKGQGTKPNIVESLAWAVLASQGGQADMVSYRDTVAALVPEDKRDKAKSKAGYYVRRWGPEDDAVRKPTSDCTGSRLAGNCDPDSQKQIYISWSRGEQDEQELHQRIEQLNQAITESAEQSGISSTGS